MNKRQRSKAWISAMVLGVFSTNAPSEAFSAEPLHHPIAAAADKPEADKANQFVAEAERLRVAGKFQAALHLAQQAVALREKLFGPNHLEVANALHTTAILHKELGEYLCADALLRRVISIQEITLGPKHLDVAASLDDLGELYWYKGEYARAERILRRALAIQEDILGKEHPTVAVSLESLSLIARATGDPIRAVSLAERAFDIVQKTTGIDSNELANATDILAWAYREQGDYARAETMLQRAIAIHEATVGSSHPSVARSLNLLTFLYILQGEYTRALPVNQRALDILEQAFGPLHPQLAYTLNYHAMLCQARGDDIHAELAFQRALHIWEKTLGPDHPHIAYLLNYLAKLYNARGDDVRARPHLERALALSERTLGPHHPVVAYALNSLGTLDLAQGNTTGAKTQIEHALAILEKTFGHAHINVAVPLHDLGTLYQAQGDLPRAELFFQRALVIREKSLGPHHPTVAVTLNALTSLHIAQSRFAKAHETAARATAIQDRNAHSLLSVGSEDQKRLYMQTLMAQTAQNIALHVDHDPQNPAAARLAFSTLLRRKGLVLDVMTDSLAALKRSLAPNDQALLDQLTRVYSQIATQASRGPGNTPPEQYRKNLADLEESRQTLESNIAKQSAAFRADHQVTLEAVQAAIPKDAVLVEIARVSRAHTKPTYVAYLLRPTGDPMFAHIGDAQRLDSAITTFRAALSDPDRTHDPKPAGRALDELLMQPIRKLLGDTQRIFVSPDGPLHMVPFAALVDEDGHYLVEKYLFSYLTSGRDLLRYENDTALPCSAPLILANPAFDESSAPKTPEANTRGLRSMDMVKDPLLSLENTLDEAQTIASLFPESRMLLGKDATEEAVKNAQSPKILHLATHGFFLPEQPIPTSLLTPRAEIPSAAEQTALALRENPLLRSGIALAGFNQRQSGKDDGVLTALEVMGLNLHGTRLAVISTCESGLGEARIGEGVYGLRRAFTMAGAETQVMSLWSVDSGHTGRLMEAYYRAIRNGQGRSDAMRDVQLVMLRQSDSNHPNLWASFIVSGQWSPLEETLPVPEPETWFSWMPSGFRATFGF